METNELAGYGFTSDIEVVENHKKKLNNAPGIFYTVSSVSHKIGIGRNTIYSFLREFNYLDENNIPYQNYVNEGYFQFYVLYVKQKMRGVLSISQKGINVILDLYKNHN